MNPWISRREKRNTRRARSHAVKLANAQCGLFTRKQVRRAIEAMLTHQPTELWRNRIVSYNSTPPP